MHHYCIVILGGTVISVAWIVIHNIDNLYVFFLNYLTVIPQACIGFEMIDSLQGTQCQVGYDHPTLVSNKHEWNNCFVKNAPKM